MSEGTFKFRQFLARSLFKASLFLGGVAVPKTDIPKGDRIWCFGLYQIGATSYDNDTATNQARAFVGDKCVYAAPLLSELGAHYILSSVPDVTVLIPVFANIKEKLSSSKVLESQ